MPGPSPGRAIAILGKESAAAVVSVIDREVDGEDLYFERIARLRPFDINRPGQGMRATSGVVSPQFLDLINRGAGYDLIV